MEKIKNSLAVVIVILFLPYVVTVLMNGKREESTNSIFSGDTIVNVDRDGTIEQIDLDEYILGVVANQMPTDYESEALKAQAVIVRSNLYKELEGKDEKEYIFQHKYLSYHDMENMWNHTDFGDNYDKLKTAVLKTDNQVLTYEGNVIEAPYHAVSSGMTRTGEEAFGTEDFPYLQAALCPGDVEAEDYLKISVFDKQKIIEACTNINSKLELDEEELIHQLYIEETDEAEYVKKIKVGTMYLAGEEFRQELGLNSSCFQLQEYHGDIRITTKGLGHGVGMSQYTANLMALSGEDYESILRYFFQNIEIESIIK